MARRPRNLAVRLAERFLEALGRERPRLPVALSATTSAGLEVARGAVEGPPEATPRAAEMVFSFPLDVPWIMKRALDTLQPAAFGSVETEIWPGLLMECGRREIPAFIINGSISQESARRWSWMSRTVRQGLRCLRAACMQTAEDARRIIRMGAPEEAVVVTGNMKFEAGAADTAGVAARLRTLLSVPAGTPLFVAGSTSGGEEAIVVESWRRAREALPDLRLLIAPRHPERFDAAARAIQKAGAGVIHRSRAAGGPPPPADHVLLLDTLGELEAAYALARVAFVGGSLVPRGGQNPLEPARAGVPVLFGPGMESFREVADGLLSCGAATEIRGAVELGDAVIRLASGGSAGRSAGEAGRRFVAAHAGATGKTMQHLTRLIPGAFR
jgi:3-deoxy-D-manno-octulosonic-acid transferase